MPLSCETLHILFIPANQIPFFNLSGLQNG